MPPKPNGFYMFMLAEQKKIKALSNRAPTMREMPGICRESWKRLPAEEKAKFDNLAKREKERLQGVGGDGVYARLDCHRQVIADRKDPVKEEKKRRTQERQSIQNSFLSEQDARDTVFHILDFQVMYDDRMEDHFPLEIGMVSFTLRKGILNFMHRFIDPGDVPQGNRHLAMCHSDNTHKIPLRFEHSDVNIKALTSHMTQFVKSDPQKDDIPPVFCLSVHRNLVENCMDFIYGRVYVNDVDKIHKVYCLEDLVSCLIANSGKVESSVSESQVYDMLIQNRWDYNSSIRCFYHEELDCSFCSLSIVRRYSFALFDILSTLLEFDLTDKHLPDEVEQNFTISEGSFGFGKQTYNTDHSRSGRPSFNNGNRYNHEEKQNAWQSPRVDPVKIPLSDDEESEEEEEEPKVTEFAYKKLRLPKSLAQVQTQVGQMSLQENAQPAPAAVPANPMLAPNSWFNPVRNAAPMVPRGRGMAPGRGMIPGMGAQIRPMGLNAPAPPPGFEPKPNFPRGAGPPGFRQPLARQNQEQFPALGRGRGMARGWASNPANQS